MLIFGIVIPNLNQSHFLPTALESMKCQSAPFNLALMDGGSTDNFNEVVLKYSDIISFLHSAPDGGQAAAIREGKRKVEGDIVAWLNADDYYFPDVLIKVAHCFEKDPELDVVYGDAIHVTPEGHFISYFLPIQKFNSKDITQTNFICQPACFVRRSAYEDVGEVDPSLNYTMDWDLWCKLAANGAKFLYLPEPLAAVRYYPDTKTLSQNKKRFSEIYNIEKKYGDRLLRVSCIGAYFYGLTFKDNKNPLENFFLILFEILKKTKIKFGKIFGKQRYRDDLLYGFHRWEPNVEVCCQIHIPWYHERAWRRLCLKVKPTRGQYRIKLNKKKCEKITYKNDYILVEIPEIQTPYRLIDIECVDRQRWRLIELAYDLN